MKRLLLLLLFIFTLSIVYPQTYENVQVSLLTVAPRSKAIYTIYGHTALRLYNPDNQTDIVLNWGTFDTDRPNFMYHFVRGETDYFLSLAPFKAFVNIYRADDATIVEQVLNIPDNQKMALVQAMETNLQPENIEYRYNYFFDNCTLRPRDIIEKFCGGELIYPEQEKPITFRDLVHECTEHHPWMQFGIDLVIGNGADSLISLRSELFLPEKLMKALDKAVVRYPDGTEQAIALSTRMLIQSQTKEQTEKPAFFSALAKPFPVSMGVFVIYLVLTLVAYRKKRRFRLPFSLLFLVSGLGGCLVASLVFFSVHPCISPNWNIVWLHPLHLFGFVSFLLKKTYPLFTWYHLVNFVLLLCFLLAWIWVPQTMDIAYIPIIGCLWLASAYRYLSLRKELC